MLVFPNAKINIGLNIVKKRPDGYHNIETVFYPIDLSDILEFVETTKNTKFVNTGIDLNIEEKDNLILKAYKLLRKEFDLPELEIHLHKIIPTGAGLGGGSSDASFMLKSLNNYFKLNISDYCLEDLAQQLGSDCPIFIKNKAVFAEGTGNIFSEIKLDLSKYFILIIKPDIHIPTKIAFSEIQAGPPKKSLKNIITLPVNEWKEYIINNFESTVFKNFPEIKKIKDTLYESGAVYVQMSGSGAAVYGLYEDKPVIPDEFLTYFYYIQKPAI
ncbi:MAG: 4-(cytidine 5'-diphospho)-2-C-methyl-D-erythritol kinase [Bacteroidales bacterium]|nr:4-(cytidine 5'-diphospho)-2-C-methyl-D-erythritol kinase [Bacteroidales bacterium]